MIRLDTQSIRRKSKWNSVEASGTPGERRAPLDLRVKRLHSKLFDWKRDADMEFLFARSCAASRVMPLHRLCVAKNDVSAGIMLRREVSCSRICAWPRVVHRQWQLVSCHIRFPGVSHNKRNNNDYNIVPHSNLRLPIIIIEHGHYRNDGGYEWYDDGKGDGVWRPAARSHRPATGGQRLLEKCGGQTNSSTQKTPNRPKYV